jgi:hypothetical protein
VKCLSRGNVVGIETAYGLDYRKVGVRVPVDKVFSLLLIVHTGFGVYLTALSNDYRGSFRRGKVSSSTGIALNLVRTEYLFFCPSM